MLMNFLRVEISVTIDESMYMGNSVPSSMCLQKQEISNQYRFVTLPHFE